MQPRLYIHTSLNHITSLLYVFQQEVRVSTRAHWFNLDRLGNRDVCDITSGVDAIRVVFNRDWHVHPDMQTTFLPRKRSTIPGSKSQFVKILINRRNIK